MNVQAQTYSASAVPSALVALPWLRVMRIAGSEAAEFLDRQLTIRVSTLQAGERAIGCWCDAKGRALCTLWIQRSENASDSFLVACHESLHDLVCKRLRMFILRAAVELQPAPELGLAVSNNSSNWSACCWQELCCVPTTDAHVDAAVAEHWAVHEIDAGFVWLDKGTSGVYLPQMLAMSKWQALDFAKGCFPGQEIIARAHYLGRVKRGLYQFQTPLQAADQITVGDPVLDNNAEQIGDILALASGIDPPDNQGKAATHGLAVLKIAGADSHEMLFCAGNDVKFTRINESA